MTKPGTEMEEQSAQTAQELSGALCEKHELLFW